MEIQVLMNAVPFNRGFARRDLLKACSNITALHHNNGVCGGKDGSCTVRPECHGPGQDVSLVRHEKPPKPPARERLAGSDKRWPTKASNRNDRILRLCSNFPSFTLLLGFPSSGLGQHMDVRALYWMTVRIP